MVSKLIFSILVLTVVASASFLSGVKQFTKTKKFNPKNEHYSECDNDCGKSCKDIGEKQVKCEKSCRSGYFCKCGYFRDPNQSNKCVLPIDCVGVKLTDKQMRQKVKPAKLECPPKEEYDECGTNCGKWCADQGKKVDCAAVTCRPGCYCKKGLLRNPKFGNVCVGEYNCVTGKHKAMQTLKRKWRQFWDANTVKD